jgi:hypothetical protein
LIKLTRDGYLSIKDFTSPDRVAKAVTPDKNKKNSLIKRNLSIIITIRQLKAISAKNKTLKIHDNYDKAFLNVPTYHLNR